jgi:D-alanine-D-alanine ligase
MFECTKSSPKLYVIFTHTGVAAARRRYTPRRKIRRRNHVKLAAENSQPNRTSDVDTEAALDEEPPGAELLRLSEWGTDAVAPCEMTVVRQPAGSFDNRRRARGIILLYSQSDPSAAVEPHDILADSETASTAKSVAEVLKRHTEYEVHLLPASHPIEARLGCYPPQDYAVFNLFEGVSGIVGDEAEAATALRTLGYRFTGAHSHALALALDKAKTKRALKRHRILTPAWRVFHHPNDVSHRAIGDLRFPLIVKPVAEDSSVGIDRKSVVTNLAGLRQRVAYVVQQYRQRALAAEFIDGREFNVAIWGKPPQVLPLAEIDFSAFAHPHERIVSFAAKWQEGSFEYHNMPVICPARVSKDLASRIRATALRVWRIAGCCGYARVDMRVRHGEIYVLEVNPNPSLALDAGFARAAKAAGYGYEQMILRILSLIGEERQW